MPSNLPPVPLAVLGHQLPEFLVFFVGPFFGELLTPGPAVEELVGAVWMGGWVGGWVVEKEAVGMSYCEL